MKALVDQLQGFYDVPRAGKSMRAAITHVESDFPVESSGSQFPGVTVSRDSEGRWRRNCLGLTDGEAEAAGGHYWVERNRRNEVVAIRERMRKRQRRGSVATDLPAAMKVGVGDAAGDLSEDPSAF